MTFWTGLLGKGLTRREVAFDMTIATDEYRSNQVTGLYQDLLGRGSEPAGKTFWLSHFDVNTIASQFLFSPEGREVLVESYYNSILHRTADPDGLAYWTQRLLNGASDEDIIARLLSSDEYFLSH